MIGERVSKKRKKSLNLTQKKKTLSKKKGNMKILAKEGKLKMIGSVECLEPGIETMKTS